MSVVARRIRATPERSASDAWQVIVDLIAPNDGEALGNCSALRGSRRRLSRRNHPRMHRWSFAARGHKCEFTVYMTTTPFRATTPMRRAGAVPNGGGVGDEPGRRRGRRGVGQGCVGEEEHAGHGTGESETFDGGDEESKNAGTAKAAINMEAFLRS